MKKAMLISLLAIAVMGLMMGNANGNHDTWNVIVNIVNGAEGPMDLKVSSGDAQFTGGGSTCTLQPGQSTKASTCSNGDSIQFTINYVSSIGLSSVYQPITVDWETAGTGPGCAAACSDGEGLYSLSDGTYVDETYDNINVGDTMAQFMGLHGAAETVVGGVINSIMKWFGYNPSISKEAEYNYSITIGQKNYNLKNLAVAAWGRYDGSLPPPVTLVQGQQVNQYAGRAWSISENLINNATMASFDTNGNALIGDTEGQIAIYQPNAPLRYHGSSVYKSVAQLSYAGDNAGRYVAAFADYSVQYFDGVNTYELEGPGTWNSPIIQMCVNWPEYPASPQILCGLANLAVLYYDGTGHGWDTIQGPFEWGSTCIMQLNAGWYEGVLQAVAGLGNGAVLWWNGAGPRGWTEMHDTSWNSPVYQLEVLYYSEINKPPAVLVELGNGAFYYFSGPTPISYTNISPAGLPCIIDVYWNGSVPVILAGDIYGDISLYQGGTWYTMPDGGYGFAIQYISADWDNFDPDDPAARLTLPYVSCMSTLFTYFEGNTTTWNYPAVPSTTSLCGDLDGDGKDDLASVEGSQWYIWHSTKQYNERSGPYDLGKVGTPVIGDMDGDGQDDFIVVEGSKWHVWLSSLRHNWHSERIESDFGIHGTPLAGDLDGDGRDDIIMVMGSLWYIWPSSSGYTQRLGPYDTGHRGLPATGDLNGDGLADMITVKGSDWYICYSIAPGQYGPWCGPYNVGVSGAPATGDLDGDGLDDLVIVVGSNWYVCFATSPGQYGAWYGPFAKSVL